MSNRRFKVNETVYQNDGENSKKRFIDYYYDNEQTKENVKRTFYLTNFYMESKLKKDVYEFTVNEIDELLNSFQATTMGSLAVRVSHLKNYVDFCIRQNIRSNPINFFDDIIDLDKYIMKNSYKYKYITRDNLYNVITSCIDNFQISVMFILAFEGVLGKLKCEMCNLKVSDIDFENKTITIRAYDVVNKKTKESTHYPERIIEIEDNRTFDIIKKSIAQTVYITPPCINEEDESDRMMDYDLADSEYLLRYVLSNNTANKERTNLPLTHSAIENRKFLANGYFKDSLELIKRLSFTTLQQSGMIDKLTRIKKENGIVTVEDFKALMRQYNKKEFSYSNLKKIWESIEKERNL